MRVSLKRHLHFSLENQRNPWEMTPLACYCFQSQCHVQQNLTEHAHCLLRCWDNSTLNLLSDYEQLQCQFTDWEWPLKMTKWPTKNWGEGHCDPYILFPPWETPCSHKRVLKWLGPIQATGKEARDNHCVLIWLSYFNWPELFFYLSNENFILCTYLVYQYRKSDKIKWRPLLWAHVTDESWARQLQDTHAHIPTINMYTYNFPFREIRQVIGYDFAVLAVKKEVWATMIKT